MTNLAKKYNSNFFAAQKEGSYRSAKEYLAYFFSFYQPNSIVDFGCGTGTWLTAAHELGVKDLVGIDGGWIQDKKINEENICYKMINLEKPIKLDRKFDLAISLEVAEHLSEIRAKSFVSDICSAADLVIFGAAIKCQDGVNHINEQWQSYWVNIFREQNYECIDFFRGKFWNDKNVNKDYVQNTFLYMKRGDERSQLLSTQEIHPIYDVCHPIFFERRSKYCSLRTYIRTTPEIPGLIVKAVLRRLINR
ncbi:MAG: methyltransferase domain-containing protein [Coleofasciculus sp. G1-WW12-02]|uniref:class I SAM-dependent methyltransferase n=1 Tax=Coleofasciculus sp. G1-WW12-02 TaxID=3068483 RepID=UPI0032FC4555